MALVIDIERFCILAARVKAHQQDKCPQCAALKAFAIEVNNGTLDLITEKMNQVKEGEKLDAQKCVDAIIGLKTGKVRNG
jgi:phage FluMu protein Com